MTKTIEQAIAEYTEQIEAQFAPNGQVDRDKIWEFTTTLDAISVLEDVADTAEDDLVDKMQALASIDNGVKVVVYNIANDDYILGDWGYNTDFHEYMEWTEEIVTRVVENFG